MTAGSGGMMIAATRRRIWPGLWVGIFSAAIAGAAMAVTPIRLIAEAEDFTPTSPGWEVVPYRDNYYASTFAITFLSRMAALSAPPQLPAGVQTAAEQSIAIPADGTYDVLGRYEQPYGFSAEFTVEILQNEQAVYRQTFGRYDDPKIWSLMGPDPAARRVPMVRYFWGATDNIVWQHGGRTPLRRGPATLRLLATAQLEDGKPRQRAANRNVDLVCLTTDAEGMVRQQQHCRTYLEMDGWLVQAGDLYVRLTNRGAESVLPELVPSPHGQHSPYYVHLRDWPRLLVTARGYVESGDLRHAWGPPPAYQLCGPRPDAVEPVELAPRLARETFLLDPDKPESPAAYGVPGADRLAPGAASGWVPMGHLLDALHLSTWVFTAPAPMRLEFAVPDGAGGLRAIRQLDLEQGTTAFEMPHTAAPGAALQEALAARYWVPRVRTRAEAVGGLLDVVRGWPGKTRRAERFYIYNLLGFGGLSDRSLHPLTHELARQLGDNTMVGYHGRKRGLYTHIRSTELAVIERELGPDNRNNRSFEDGYIVSYGDETHLPAAPMSDAELADWLTARDIAWDGEVRVTQDRSQPLYYYSQLAATEKGAAPYIAATAFYARHGILTGANYSPHGNYFVSDLHYIRPFKLRALSMPWTEDYVWQVPEFSIQIYGYLASALRAGAKYDNLPLHLYVMPHSPGNTARDFTLSFYTAVAHGARMINYFCASPSAVGGTENYVDTNDLRMWRAIHDCTWSAGLFEDYVMDGRVRPARVGLLLSSVEDIRGTASNHTLAMHNNERKAIYLALRHAQVPVDFLSEDDVIEGLASDYCLIYVTQRWLHSRAVAALQRWVAEGGTLAAMAGGGFRDEFDRPNAETAALYGVVEQELSVDPQLVDKYLLQPDKPFFPKQDLPPYEPIDTVTWAVAQVKRHAGVIVWKQRLTPGDGEVLGTYSDGTPAAVGKQHGAGRAILFGFLPGQAYLKSGLPLRPVDRSGSDEGYTHFLPTTMDPGLRQAVVDDLLPADYRRPVVCSETLVESTCIDTRQPAARLCVPLINYSGVPIPALTVRIAGVRQARHVRSLRQDQLAPTFDAEGLTVVLPVDTAEMLLIDR